MAFLIPENLASRNDVPSGLQSVAKAMRDLLPDEVTVWLESDDAGPYLVLLDPAAGVLVIDTPSPDDVGVGRSTGRRKVAKHSPIPVADLAARVESRALDLSQLLGAEQRLDDSFPSGATAAIPSLKRSRILNDGGDEEEVAGLLLAEDFTAWSLRDAIARVLGTDSVPALDELGERLVRGIVRPEIVISGRAENGPDQLVFRVPGDLDGEDIRVLDRQQERLAHDLGAGYRVIRGVAGSGKSLVLTFRARHLAEQFPQWMILLTCFNIVLAEVLIDQLKDCPNVKVRHVDALAKDVLQSAGRWHSGKDIDWTQVRNDAARLLGGSNESHRYDIVLVDEAQDLDAAGLSLAFAALKSKREDFVIALDGAQNLYRKKARWNPPRPQGTTARGRTTVLKRAYRNTREIAELAWHFLCEAGAGEFNDESIDDPTVIVQPEYVNRHGPVPEVLQCTDARAEINAILDRIERHHKDGVPWSDMAVLFGSTKHYQDKFFYECRDRDIPYFYVTLGSNTKREVISCGDVVRSAGFQGLKGLEFPKVFVCGVNDVWDPASGDDPGALYRLAYVAMTRAMDELVVTVSGSGMIGQAVQRARDRLDG